MGNKNSAGNEDEGVEAEDISGRKRHANIHDDEVICNQTVASTAAASLISSGNSSTCSDDGDFVEAPDHFLEASGECVDPEISFKPRQDLLSTESESGQLDQAFIDSPSKLSSNADSNDSVITNGVPEQDQDLSPQEVTDSCKGLDASPCTNPCTSLSPVDHLEEPAVNSDSGQVQCQQHLSDQGSEILPHAVPSPCEPKISAFEIKDGCSEVVNTPRLTTTQLVAQVQKTGSPSPLPRGTYTFNLDEFDAKKTPFPVKTKCKVFNSPSVVPDNEVEVSQEEAQQLLHRPIAYSVPDSEQLEEVVDRADAILAKVNAEIDTTSPSPLVVERQAAHPAATQGDPPGSPTLSRGSYNINWDSIDINSDPSQILPQNSEKLPKQDNNNIEITGTGAEIPQNVKAAEHSHSQDQVGLNSSNTKPFKTEPIPPKEDLNAATVGNIAIETHAENTVFPSVTCGISEAEPTGKGNVSDITEGKWGDNPQHIPNDPPQEGQISLAKGTYNINWDDVDINSDPNQVGKALPKATLQSTSEEKHPTCKEDISNEGTVEKQRQGERVCEEFQEKQLTYDNFSEAIAEEPQIHESTREAVENKDTASPENLSCPSSPDSDLNQTVVEAPQSIEQQQLTEKTPLQEMSDELENTGAEQVSSSPPIPSKGYAINWDELDEFSDPFNLKKSPGHSKQFLNSPGLQQAGQAVAGSVAPPDVVGAGQEALPNNSSSQPDVIEGGGVKPADEKKTVEKPSRQKPNQRVAKGKVAAPDRSALKAAIESKRQAMANEPNKHEQASASADNSMNKEDDNREISNAKQMESSDADATFDGDVTLNCQSEMPESEQWLPQDQVEEVLAAGSLDTWAQSRNYEASNSRSNLARESLFVKFDPLVKANSPKIEGQRTPEREALDQNITICGDELLGFDTPPTVKKRELKAVERVDRGGQPTSDESRCLDIPDKLNLLNLSHAAPSDSSEQTERSHSSRASGSEELLQLQGDILVKEQKWAAERESLQCENKNLLSYNKRILENLEKDVDLFERMALQREEMKRERLDEVVRLRREKEQCSSDLHSVETSLFDLQGRYTRSKANIDAHIKNEKLLEEDRNRYQAELKVERERYITLKQQAEDKINTANAEMLNVRKQAEAEVTGLEKSLKMAKMKNDSLQQSLQQKTAENAELTKICDELIAKCKGPS